MLHLLLAFASLLEAAGLGHRCLHDDQPAPLVAEHATASGPQLTHADEPVHNGCPRCQLSSKRFFVSPPSVQWQLHVLDRAVQPPLPSICPDGLPRDRAIAVRQLPESFICRSLCRAIDRLQLFENPQSLGPPWRIGGHLGGAVRQEEIRQPEWLLLPHLDDVTHETGPLQIETRGLPRSRPRVGEAARAEIIERSRLLHRHVSLKKKEVVILGATNPAERAVGCVCESGGLSSTVLGALRDGSRHAA